MTWSLEEVDLFRHVSIPLVCLPHFSKSGLIAKIPSDTQKTPSFSEATGLAVSKKSEVFEKVEGVMAVGAPRVFWVRGTILLQLGAADMDLKRLWGFKI